MSRRYATIEPAAEPLPHLSPQLPGQPARQEGHGPAVQPLHLLHPELASQSLTLAPREAVFLTGIPRGLHKPALRHHPKPVPGLDRVPDIPQPDPPASPGASSDLGQHFGVKAPRLTDFPHHHFPLEPRTSRQPGLKGLHPVQAPGMHTP